MSIVGAILVGLFVAIVAYGLSCDVRRWLERPRKMGLGEREAARALGYELRLISGAPQHPPLNRSRPLVSEPSGSRGEQEFEGGTRDSTA